jgi:predicted ester cyclase
MGTEENKELIRREYEDGLNNRDWSLLEELMDPDYVGHFGAITVRGFQAYKEFTNGLLTAFPDLVISLEDLIGEGEKVAVRLAFRGTHQGEFLGVAPTHRQVTFSRCDIYHIVDGKLAEEWVELDVAGILQQIGALTVRG